MTICPCCGSEVTASAVLGFWDRALATGADDWLVVLANDQLVARIGDKRWAMKLPELETDHDRLYIGATALRVLADTWVPERPCHCLRKDIPAHGATAQKGETL